MVSYKSSAVKIFCSYIRRYGFHLSDHSGNLSKNVLVKPIGWIMYV